MAAAYAAVVSLMHTINELQRHPQPPISLHKQQLQSLTHKLTFFQDFLETYNGGDSQEADGLESRIADTALAAENIIESRIVDQILTGSTNHEVKTSGVDFDEALQKVIEDMDSIKKVAMELKQDKVQRGSKSGRLSKIHSTQESKLTVGFDGMLLELMDKLTRGLPLRFIPVVGMGGIGKTTLAKYVYSHETVVQHFIIRAWATISQECILKEILLELLNGIEKEEDHKEDLRDRNEHDLGEKLHKILFGRRYLIIMDDIWDIEIWKRLKFYFPDNNNGSRVVFTTRLSALAKNLSDSLEVFKLDFLNENDSWNLFCKIVFGEEDCPIEMEEIGKHIVESCRGLPLSIKVIGGLLSVSAQTPQNWEHIAENLSSIVNSEDNEHCLKVLYTSYKNLPVYLKPCFLYMGMFREDSKVHVSGLIKLWVAEGFLKPKDGRSLEDVAKEYLGELVDRNLILVEEPNYCGKLKLFKIHDLLRDFCLREARQAKFFCVLDERRNYYGKPKLERRSYNGKLKLCNIYYLLRDLCLRKARKQNFLSTLDRVRHIWSYDGRKLDPSSVAQCLNLNHKKSDEQPIFGGRLSYATDYLPRHEKSLLQHLLVVFQRVNLRYINLGRSFNSGVLSEFPIYLLWNLQTLDVDLSWENDENDVVPFEIWKMPRLRHVRIWKVFELTNPPTDDVFVLENLQKLSHVRNFKCSEEVVKRIPNIMKLKLAYLDEFQCASHDYCLGNIGDMHKLTSLGIENKVSGLSSQMQSLTLPHSLTKLTLQGTKLRWEDMTKMVGSLPLLEYLRLGRDACVGIKWVTTEGQFCSLKVLEIYFARVVYWETEKDHFPRLEHIVLFGIYLGEIPSCIGDIDTLQSFTLRRCFRSARDSAYKIKEEQEELENVTLQFDICSQDSTLNHILKMNENEDEDEDEDWAARQAIKARGDFGWW